MSPTHNVRKLLDIQDSNIIFEGNCVTDGIYKEKNCKYVDGKLTYIPTYCENCGVKNEQDTVIKDSTQLSRITLPITGLQPTYLRLKKQRFVCKDCKSSFTAETPIVKRNCFISEHTQAQVVLKAAGAQPLLAIARDCPVSPITVQRVITNVALAYKP